MRLLASLLLLNFALLATWPMFRGEKAAGVNVASSVPAAWDVGGGKNIRWKTPIPGLGHSSPIVVGDRVFVTTAVSSDPKATFKPGLYGAGTASADRSVHRFMLICLDRRTGKVLWERVAWQGEPKEKRHIKSTYANATPASDGRVVVAYFGSNGLYAFDMQGKKLWSFDPGRIDAGAYDSPDYEWGTASSPVIHGDLVLLQVDQQKGSYLVALQRATGRTVWRTVRDELPSWGTPNVFDNLVLTNASNAIRAYSVKDGTLAWQIGGSSKITAPTPIISEGIIVVCSGRRPEAPIFAIDPTGKVRWSKTQRGPYMPTPLIHAGILYVLGNAGIFDAYRLKTGDEIYRERIPHAGSGFSASPVSTGRLIFLSSEDGDVFVVKPGERFDLVTKNAMGEPIMATPALVRDMMLLRTQHTLFAIGEPAAGKP